MLFWGYSATLAAQITPGDWRHIGTAAIDLGLGSLATGPVDRVWYSDDGARLFVRTHSGRIFQTDDFENWSGAPGVTPPAENEAPAAGKPELSARLRFASGAVRLYGVGKAVYRSDDGGSTWTNLSQYRGASLLGDGLADLAASPRDPDDLAVAAATGVWRSTDGGLSWTGLNQALPNLPGLRIYALPAGSSGLRMSLAGPNSPEVEWAPGENAAWRPVPNTDVSREEVAKADFSRRLNAPISAIARSGNYLYLGSSEGQLWSSADRGETWSPASDRLAGPVESIYVNPRDARIALVAIGARSQASAPAARWPHVLRTMNGGIFWDDISSNLPDVAAHAVVADPTSGAIYLANDNGVFLTTTELSTAGRATTWASVSDRLPRLPASDVKLDAGGNQLYVALDGPGVFTTLAPHRVRDVRLVNAADYSSRPAAPGGLLSVIGARVQSAQLADSAVPVLDASDAASQIQVPFDAQGSAISLAVQSPAGRYTLGLPLQSVSPAIFVNPDGSPWIMDAATGVLLDSSKPAKAKSHIQIFATGLGRVTPDWPAGVPAPISDPPQIRASVRAYLNGVPLDVTQATLAPGYIGSYLVEAELPAFVNNGPAELFMEAEGRASNRVRIYIQQ